MRSAKAFRLWRGSVIEVMAFADQVRFIMIYQTGGLSDEGRIPGYEVRIV